MENATYSKFCLLVREIVLNKLLDEAEHDRESSRKVVEEVWRRGNFSTIAKGTKFSRVAGADASSYSFPLSSRFLAVVSAVIYRLPSARRFFIPPIVFEIPHLISDEKFGEILCLRREAFMYQTASEFLKRHGGDVELILVDGPLVFSGWYSGIGEERDRRKLSSNVNELLNLCEEGGIAIAGVVKRPTARYYLKCLGLEEETSLSDSAILVHILKRGGRTELFSPASPFMDRIDFLIDSFYARLSNIEIVSPVRIDIPKFSRSHVDDIAGYCYRTAFSFGLPLLIIKADEEARLTVDFMREIYGEALCRLKREFGDGSWLSLRERRWLRE